MRVVEQTIVLVWKLDGDDSGRQEMCCDGWASADYVLCLQDNVGEPREATQQEIEAMKENK